MPNNCRNCGAPLDDSLPGDLIRCPFCGKVTREQPARVPQRLPEGQGPHVPGQGGRTPIRAPGVLVAVLAASGMGLLIAIGAATTFSGPTSGGDCPSSFGRSGEVNCRCRSGQLSGAVWGTDIYTTDSSFCAAAVHAGAIAATGGRVTAHSAPGCASYTGTTRNGVTTHDWGSYGSSFYFVGHGTGDCVVGSHISGGDCPSRFGNITEVDCTCGSGQLPAAVWGTDIYTTDSSFCAAAVHAGATTASGGRVTARSAPGCASYAGTTRNGVTTLDWGSYGSSFYFVGHGTGKCATASTPSEERCPSRYPIGTAQVECTCASDQFGGTVWGTDLYTTDSAFCQAALHAGAVAARGGCVMAREAPGARRYEGTRRNGVTTSAWGAYPHSFRFLDAAADAKAPERKRDAPHRNPRLHSSF